MKPASIEKIHKFGKASYIVARVSFILSLIVTVLFSVITLPMLFLPSSMLKADVLNHTCVEVDISGFGDIPIDPDKIPILSENLADQHFEINGMPIVAASMDGSIITLEAQPEVTRLSYATLSATILCTLMAIIAVLILVHYICRFCKGLRDCITPFDPALVASLEKLAWATLVIPIVTSLMSTLMTSSQVGSFQLELDVDAMVLVLVFSMFALSYIFKYGARLQQESDETL